MKNKRPRRIAVALAKGGVGKTTTAVNLSHGLALAGHNVLLVDCDTQGQAAVMLGLQPEGGLAEFLDGDAGAIIEARSGLDLLAGGDALAGRADLEHVGAIADALRPVEGRYDFIVLDTAPGWDIVAVNVLFYTAEILAPVSLDVLTLHSLGQFTRRLDGIRQGNPDLTLSHILPTFQDRRVRKSADLLNELREVYGRELCEPIRYSARLAESPSAGQTIYEYAPRSSGAIDYQFLTDRIRSYGRSKQATNVSP